MTESFGKNIGKKIEELRDTVTRGTYNALHPGQKLSRPWAPRDIPAAIQSSTRHEIGIREEAIKKAESLATTDALTGLPNRRAFDYRLVTIKESRGSTLGIDPKRSADKGRVRSNSDRRDEHDYAIVFFDIDDFKNYNSKYGHAGGNKVLKAIGALIGNSVADGRPITLRKDELFARYGGEEFVAVLEKTGREDGEKFAERVKEAVNKIRITDDDGKERPDIIGVSCGVASTENPAEIEKVVDQANQALVFGAKKRGKNCVVSFDQTIEELARASSTEYKSE